MLPKTGKTHRELMLGHFFVLFTKMTKMHKTPPGDKKTGMLDKLATDTDALGQTHKYNKTINPKSTSLPNL